MNILMKCAAPAVLGAIMLAGCGQNTTETASAPAEAPQAAAPAATTPAKAPPVKVTNTKTVKVGDQAVCVVCAVKEGTKTPEEVKAVLAYKGKTYPFCNLEEKAEFISNPAKYAR